jgi:hypothetical protein
MGKSEFKFLGKQPPYPVKTYVVFGFKAMTEEKEHFEGALREAVDALDNALEFKATEACFRAREIQEKMRVSLGEATEGKE